MSRRNLARVHVESRHVAPALYPVGSPDGDGEAAESRSFDASDDPNVAVFEFDPGDADAAEDLAGELGAQFIEGATRVEDLGDRVNAVDDASEADVPMQVEDELGPDDLDDDLEPLSAVTESTRFSLEDSEGDGLPDDDDFDDVDDVIDEGLDGDDLEE